MQTRITDTVRGWMQLAGDADPLRIHRSLLVVGAVAYLVFGIVYQTADGTPDPLFMTERVATAVFCALLLVLSYINHSVKKNLPNYLFALIFLATVRTLHAAHLHQFRLDVAMSIVVIVMMTNLIFEPGPVVLTFNIVIVVVVAISAALAPHSLLNRWAYLLSLTFVAAASYYIARTRYSIARDLAVSQKEYRRLFTHMTAGFAHCRPLFSEESGRVIDYKIRECNTAFGALFDLCPEEVSGHSWSELFPESEEVESRMRRALIEGHADRFDWYLDPRGKWLVFSAYRPQKGRVAVVLTDVTEVRRREEAAVHLSLHDPVTNLYNRRFFDAELSRLDTPRQLPVSIIVVDINSLKSINDVYGHRQGDEVIRSVGQILDSVTRSEDIVARVGGDEFAALLPDTDAGEAAAIVGRIRAAVESLDQTGSLPFFLGVAVGCATKCRAEEDLTHLFDEADARMYRDK